MIEYIVFMAAGIGVGALIAGLFVWFFQRLRRKKERQFMGEMMNHMANSADLLILLYSPQNRKMEFVSDSAGWLFGLDREKLEENIQSLFGTLNIPMDDFFTKHILAGDFPLYTEKEYTTVPKGAKERRRIRFSAFPMEDGRVFLVVRDDTYINSLAETLYTAANVIDVFQQRFGIMTEPDLVKKINEQIKPVFEKPKEQQAQEPQKRMDLDVGSLCSGKHILLVEDSENSREFAGGFLRKNGAVVDMAANGEEAIKQFLHSEEGYYDLVLMDIQMPVMDGNEAARRIRLLERRDAKVVPIVAMTTYLFSEDIRSSFRAGMDMHIAKPLNDKKLMDVMKKYLIK